MSGTFKNATVRTTEGITSEDMRNAVVALVPLEYDDTATFTPKGGGKSQPWSQLHSEVLICTGEHAGTHEDKVSIRGNLADQIANQVPDNGWKKTNLIVRVVSGADVTGDPAVRWWGIEPVTDDEFDEAKAFVREFFEPQRAKDEDPPAKGRNGSRARSSRSSDAPF
jgi:hypothetical protein